MADTDGSTHPLPVVRTGQGSTKITRAEFSRRWRERFYDPGFETLPTELERLEGVAWEAYDQYHKSPRTRLAGPGFADPSFPLPIEWLEARDRIREAQTAHDSPAGPSRILLVCASPRSDETCPGEMSKTFRLAEAARETLERGGDAQVDLLDLSHLTAEFGRVIFPCKACVSTAMPLCHWPCSCYPNHAMGQVGDWMNEIYPRWVAAHGVMIVTPVHWYQAPSVLKLMMDRLVCADGGNPDPTSTHGKKPDEAKALELEGWPYPRHLAGRAFALLIHGDAGGTDAVRRGLHDWLTDMSLIPADGAILDRYIGYYEPYAASHVALDRDQAIFVEARRAAETLADAVRQLRGGYRPPEARTADPRPK